MRRSPSSNLALSFLAVLGWASDAGAQPYRVVQLQRPAGDSACSAIKATSSRHAIGRSEGPDSTRYVLWDPDGQPTVLPVPPYTRTLLINESGELVGTRGLAPPPPFFPRGAPWPSVPFALIGGQAIDLPAPPNPSLLAIDFTDTGILLMSTQDSASRPAGPYWALYQGTLYQVTDGGVTLVGVSDAGLIGGNTFAGPRLQEAGGAPFAPWPDNVTLRAVGPAGHAIGYDFSPDGLINVRYRTPDGALTILALPGIGIGTGRMNHAGQLVGRHLALDGSSTVFFSRDGQLVDLNTLIDPAIPRLLGATQITDNGVILAALEGPSDACGVYLVPVVPAAPASLTFTVDGRTVTLAWAASAGATDYLVEAGSVPGLSDLYRASVGARPGLSVSAPPGRYYVRVRARNAVGESQASAEIVVGVP